MFLKNPTDFEIKLVNIQVIFNKIKYKKTVNVCFLFQNDTSNNYVKVYNE